MLFVLNSIHIGRVYTSLLVNFRYAIRLLLKSTGLSSISHVQKARNDSRAMIAQLEQRIRWFSENQEFIDRDAAVLKEKDARIAALERELENIRNEEVLKTHSFIS